MPYRAASVEFQRPVRGILKFLEVSNHGYPYNRIWHINHISGLAAADTGNTTNHDIVYAAHEYSAYLG